MYNNNNERNYRCSCRSGRISRFLVPAILLLLAEKSSHGYELTERYSKLGFTVASPDPGAIYRTLKLLESEGLIKSKWRTTEPGPAKKIYSITEDGSELLSKWVAEIKERKKTFELFLERYKKINKAV